MFVRLWRFRIPEGDPQAFLDAYGPTGAWARLFRTSPGFLGTDLLADDSSRSFLTVDRWVHREAWLAFLEAHQTAYAALDRETETLVSEEEQIGEFTAVP